MLNIKTGIDYFPLDVDFFDDEKIQLLSARFGVKGEVVAIRLLCRIYRQGYYIDWNDDMALLVAKSVGDIGQHSCVTDIVNELVKRGFFNKNILNSFSILTSRSIQERYLNACSRRKKVVLRADLLLIDPSNYQNVYILGENDNALNQNVDILKQSKVKESKVKESICVVPTLTQISDYCKDKGYGIDVQAFFDYYNDSDWIDSKGNPVINWKQKIISWSKRNPGVEAEKTAKPHKELTQEQLEAIRQARR